MPVCQYDISSEAWLAMFDCDTVGNAITSILGRQPARRPNDSTNYIGRKSVLESKMQNIAIEKTKHAINFWFAYLKKCRLSMANSEFTRVCTPQRFPGDHVIIRHPSKPRLTCRASKLSKYISPLQTLQQFCQMDWFASLGSSWSATVLLCLVFCARSFRAKCRNKSNIDQYSTHKTTQ